MVVPSLFAPGAQVVLDAPLATLPRCASVIRGYRPDRCPALDLPLCKGQKVRVEAGVECLVRLLAAERVAVFRCQSRGRSLAPESLLFLQDPASVEYGRVRKGQSLQVLFDVTLDPQPGDAVPMGGGQRDLVVGISEDGCLLQTARAFSFGTKLLLNFNLPEVGQARDLAVTVKSARRTDAAWLVEGVFDPACDAGRLMVRRYHQLLNARQLDAAMLRVSTLE